MSVCAQLIRVLQPDFENHIKQPDWTAHEASCLMAGLEPLPPGNLAILYDTCHEYVASQGRSLQYDSEILFKPRRLTKKAIERNCPNHPLFEPIQLFNAVPSVKPDHEDACDKWLAELVPEFVKRYKVKVEYEGIVYRSSLKDAIRKTESLHTPKDVVYSALKQCADLPAELRSLVEQHEDTKPAGESVNGAPEHVGQSQANSPAISPVPVVPTNGAADGIKGAASSAKGHTGKAKARSRKGVGGRPKGPSKKDQARMDKKVYEGRKSGTPYEVLENELNLTHKQAMDAYERHRKRVARRS